MFSQTEYDMMKKCMCRTAPTAAVVTPVFESSALIELPGGTTADPSSLLTHRQLLHLVVLQVQPASTALTHTTPDASRMSTSPSTASAASLGAASQQHSWGQLGASPPGQVGPGPLLASSLGNAATGALPGTMVRSAPPAYFLTATASQHGQQQAVGRSAPPLQSSTDLLRFSSRTSVVGTCQVDWREGLACKGEASGIVQMAGPQGKTVGHLSLDLEVTRLLQSSCQYNRLPCNS